MQVFANDKQRFHSFVEFYVIHLKTQEVKNWSHCSSTWSLKTKLLQCLLTDMQCSQGGWSKSGMWVLLHASEQQKWTYKGQEYYTM